MHKSMEEQLEGCGCVLHPEGVCSFSLTTDPDIAVTGTPCPPYSRQRAKRTVEGSVKSHPLHQVTNETLPNWIALTEPKPVILEQVLGFAQKCDANDEASPMVRPPQQICM